MGQQEVYNYLKKQTKFVASNKINKRMKLSSTGNINASLRKMLKNNEVERRKIKMGPNWMYEYKLK